MTNVGFLPRTVFFCHRDLFFFKTLKWKVQYHKRFEAVKAVYGTNVMCYLFKNEVPVEVPHPVCRRVFHHTHTPHFIFWPTRRGNDPHHLGDAFFFVCIAKLHGTKRRP